MEWLRLTAAVLSGVAVTIPLVCKLVEYVKKAAREKNWSKLVTLVVDYMERAEDCFANGDDRKKWVMAMVSKSGNLVDYELDEYAYNRISSMIDRICEASKVINSSNGHASEDELDLSEDSDE